MMIKAILIDDEPHCTKMLQWEIKNHCPEIEIAAICHSGQEGLDAIATHLPDIVFLDIEMPSMNGFEMLSRLDKVDFDVIFTTAYDHFAIKAIRISALDYLLKPVNNVELKAAVAKYRERSRSVDFSERISLLFDQIRQPEAPSERMLFISRPMVITARLSWQTGAELW
jgi:two-component system LytT family response regulator